MARRNLSVARLLAMALLPAVWAYAQAEPPSSTQPMSEDRMQPAEPGLRLTRTLARTLVDGVVGQNGMARYGLDERAQKKAMGLITDRVMEFAGNNQERVQTLLEAAFQSLCENGGRITPARARQCAELARPLVPALREMAARCAEEIRLQVPPGEQLKFAGDMLLLSTLFDVSEKRLERWAKGEVTDGENLNVYSSPEIEEFWAKARGAESKDEESKNGEPRALREARSNAAEWLQWDSTKLWRRLVDNAISYYRLDASQKQAAESILREMEGRAKSVQTDEWTAKMLLNRTKHYLLGRGGGMDGWNSPRVWLLDREYRAFIRPIRDMTDELRERLDTLPTQEQRNTAAARVAEELKKLGWRE